MEQIKNNLGHTIKAVIHTDKGAITVQLYPDLVPMTVKNFVELAKQGYYDGVIFHRVIRDFMIQTGDPTGTGMGGQSIYGDAFNDEFHDQLHHYYGAVSMANSGPDTNGSQFFIVQMKEITDNYRNHFENSAIDKQVRQMYELNGGTYWLDGHHTVFGHVIDGMDVVEKIAEVECDAQDKPLEEIHIKTIDIEDADASI